VTGAGVISNDDPGPFEKCSQFPKIRLPRQLYGTFS
jgi:hypothetical protein